MHFRKILVASHDTAGARAAERLALSLCAPGGAVLHLYVVPDFWKGMMGDDWLNNAITQARYGRYLEDRLAEEIDQARQRLGREAAAAGLGYRFEMRLGRPAAHLLEVARTERPDAVVVGSPRPKGTPGYRSRLDLDVVVRSLTAPLVIAPFPADE